MKAGHADHPGTSLQIYAGVMIKFFHLFRSEKNIVEDVIINPEWYLFRIGITSCLLISICIFLAGWLMMRFTKNIFYSLLVQATHLVSILALFFSQNLMTEFILVTTGLLLAPLTVAYSFSAEDKRGFKIICVAAILYGIMIAGKISSFPVVFVWLFMANNLKHRIVFLLTALLSFILFTFPGWHYAPQFYNWIVNMTTHTGSYGQGSVGFANKAEYFESLKKVANDSWFFTITFFIISFILIKQCIGYFRRTKTNPQKAEPRKRFTKYYQTLAGIWFAFALQVFLVCKTYSPHYLIPIHLLIVPAWIIIIHGSNKRIHEIISQRVILFKIIPVLFSMFLLVRAVKLYNFFPGLKQPDKLLLEIAKPYKYDLLLLDCGITAPFPQPALFFGVNYTGEMAAVYYSVLEKNYEGFYFVNRETGQLKSWSKKDMLPKDALKNEMQLLYYSTDDKFNPDSIKWMDENIKTDSVLLSYKLPNSSESISVIKIKK